MKWNNEADEVLLKLWAEGKSASEIAEVLLVTRNAVIGRATRLRNQGATVNRREITVARKIHKTKEPVMAVEPPPAPKPVEPTPQVESMAASQLVQSLLNLRSDQCKWPLETTFCEEEREQGRPYCAHHRKVSFRSAYEGAKK